ncbi:MAG: hypothetical protein Tp138OMZ00d2C19078261_12 [Prokaryotic dsDNA virus sp.]|jgi:hypothetical protein|nr:MAG: hypothetical protein Tp138OMZ00d2C19078261_12 [Prokaryotic dsDNA virus sp.]|tara:strand:- start:14390 stop:14962 length:573 start_codon:yes stop_codon:yes gene_type:complete
MADAYKVVWLDYGKSWFEARLTGNATSEKYHHEDEVQRLVAEARAERVTVRPLEWSHKPEDPQGYTWSARKPFGSRYYLHERDGLHSWRGDYVSLSDAKAAAQADYERRILSALSDAPPRQVTPQEAAKVLLAEWGDHGEGPLGELVCYTLFHSDDRPSYLQPCIDGDLVKFSELEAALRALANGGDIDE